MKDVIIEAVGCMLFILGLVGFCFLCIAGSGYHWE